MANEKNKINELVSIDNEATAELEALTCRQHRTAHATLPESDDDTFDVSREDGQDSPTIAKLRYDIEQLRAKWMGREAEIRVREEITESLHAELAQVRDSLAAKDKLLANRDLTIRSLNAELRERDEKYRAELAALEAKLEASSRLVHDTATEPHEVPAPRKSVPTAERLTRTEDYADLLRRKLQDLLARHDDTEKERGRLDAALQRSAEREAAQHAQIGDLEQAKADLEARLVTLEEQHAEEIRTLRFELGEAQETAAQTEVLNTRLASDLDDTRGFKEQLERMLCDSDEQSKARIEELEKDVGKITREARQLEEKLQARSNAINVLLAELARKSEQMDSIEEMSEVISDIDGRISGEFDEADAAPRSARPQERVTRVLIGKIGDKLLRFPLFKDRLTIGRTSENDIQLNAPYISRRHAVVTTNGDRTRVIDWGSKNGVQVNSRRVTEHFLSNGDVLTIGNAHFRYEERRKRDS